jgi:glutamate--cysteine ligase catalytic subunit
MDIQLTDYENTVLIVILGLIVNIINHFNLNFIIPITYADENMDRAHRRNAVSSEKFWFNVNCV